MTPRFIRLTSDDRQATVDRLDSLNLAILQANLQGDASAARRMQRERDHLRSTLERGGRLALVA